ncbi:MAG: DUF1542 domain-containing protein [Paludibacteraceae bacterium]|nr:DUF1542 domain-containing protein [Paludibacteraceae bacterium]
MRKLTILFALLTLSAGLWAQEINAVKFVQGQTTDWYLLSTNPEVTFTDHNPVIAGKTYDLANGNVETAFDTDPLPVIKEAAIADINNVAAAAKEEIDGLGVDESAKSDAKAQIGNIVNTVTATINAATSKDAIDKAKTEAIAKIHDVVQTTKNMWISVRTDGTAGNWNTICLERNITDIDGATFWTVSGQDATSFILDQVTEPEAGQGYLIRFTAAELKVKYGDQVAYTPAIADETNPIQGTFTQIDAAETNVLVGNYIVYENQLRKVVSWVGLYAHRAYVVADLVPNGEPQHAPKAARAYMPKPNSTPTDNSSLHHSINSSFKMIKDGQFVIIRDNKMYNAQGILIN